MQDNVLPYNKGYAYISTFFHLVSPIFRSTRPAVGLRVSCQEIKREKKEKRKEFSKKKLLKMKNKKRQSLYSERISQHHNTHAELQ